jgi:hypothetical protein
MLQGSLELGILQDEEMALRTVDGRNVTTHLYDNATSHEVFGRIKSVYVKLYTEALGRIRAKE